MKKNELPKPEEGLDFDRDEWRRYMISIDVEIDELQGNKSDSEICSKAIELFREGAIDGNTTIVHSEKIKDVKLDCNSGLLFDCKAWQILKRKELELHNDGTPFSPWEKAQPASQTGLERFLGTIIK